MGAYDNCIILIPALQPDERLTQMIHGLHERGFHKIAVMDDGSSDDRQKYFQEVEIMGVKVIHHSKKMGKGVALSEYNGWACPSVIFSYRMYT